MNVSKLPKDIAFLRLTKDFVQSVNALMLEVYHDVYDLWSSLWFLRQRYGKAITFSSPDDEKAGDELLVRLARGGFLLETESERFVVRFDTHQPEPGKDRTREGFSVWRIDTAGKAKMIYRVLFPVEDGTVLPLNEIESRATSRKQIVAYHKEILNFLTKVTVAVSEVEDHFGRNDE